jgi:hypothetical protein
MKMLVAILGIVALGLTVWPIALVEWFWQTHPRGFETNAVSGFMLISLLAGFIIAICGTMISNDEAASALWYIGRALCIVTFCIEGAVVIWIIHGFTQFSHFGVN